MLASEFSLFVRKIAEQLSFMCDELKDSRFSCTTSPSGFEMLVYEASEKVILKNKLNCCIKYSKGAYAFPDIVYEFDDGSSFGIEVKSSINLNASDHAWSTLGNSILGSTRIDVEDIHIIFIKVNKNGCFINHARYEDAVADIVVTHSPRFKLNLSQEASQSFFAKSGIKYKDLTDSNDPIGLITHYFKSQGETAWWIAESKPALIKIWSEIPQELKDEVLSKSFVLFPDLIYSTSSDKYKKLTKWLVASYSIVSPNLRDNFTAGGRFTIEIENSIFSNMPRIFKSFHDSLSLFSVHLEETTLEELQTFWTEYLPIEDTFEERLSFWQNIVEQHMLLLNRPKIQLDFIRLLLSKINRP